MANEPFPLIQYLWVVGGILISLALPLLRKLLPPIKFLDSNKSMNTYLVVGLFSLLTALLVVAFGGSQTKNWFWYTSLLAGYAWDSTLQKIAGS